MLPAINDYQARVERALEQRLPNAEIPPQQLHQAMRYATLGAGKRIRPVLVYATGAALDVDLAQLDGPACAVEFIHAYSLIHDDLPAMDDDDLRRGKPSCHKAFDEATAILAGDALQALAFQVLADDKRMVADAALRLQLINTLAQAIGSGGMVGGQAIDLAAVGQSLNLAELENMHNRKTGALICTSVLMGALSRYQPASSTEIQQKLARYGQCIGLAFQIRDDILDVTADTATLGKTSGADQALAKPTYPELLGLEGARQHATSLCDEALANIAELGPEADTLRWIANYIINREH